MRTFALLEIRFEYVLVGKLANRRIIRRKIRSCDSGIRATDSLHLYVTDSYFDQTNTALYPKSENSPPTADDR